MSKIGRWKNIFGHREKVAVKVGAKTELLTDTQSYRFSEISETRDAPMHPAYQNPLNDTRYSLEDAAFRLMITEDDVLAKAAAGGLRLYVDVAGKSGHWARRDLEGNVSQSSIFTIRAGLLKLRSKACDDLAKHGRAIVRTLDLCRTNGLTTAGLDDDTLASLRAWGPGDKQFFPLHPVTIERGAVILLPPLA
ncbi:MAG: hypothetical protein QNI98_04560 [Woeseiaceae bacterium]|nr:hypothetical protein [Woeseiaceae bacterium]